ncbi:MAG: hypothetical protein JWM80_505 [Cyanobacteria bacterium RYN_339]|nr:hypothetical protein [Cyanobacteria bacterium RYN_339]
MAFFALVVGLILALEPPAVQPEGERELEQGMALEAERTPEGLLAARQHYAKAVRLGYLDAYRSLASMLDRGEGGPPDRDQALALLEQGAKLGDPAAMEDAAAIYTRRQDPTRALFWLDQLLEAYDEDAAISRLVAFFKSIEQVQLPNGFKGHLAQLDDRTGRVEFIEGLLFLRGLGEVRDAARALELLKASASRGYAPAFAVLGDAYALGLGVLVDLPRAADYYRNGASRDDRDCLLGLGWLRATGQQGVGYTSLPGTIWERTPLADQVALFDARLDIINGSSNALQAAFQSLLPRKELPEARRLLGGFPLSSEHEMAYRPGAFSSLEARAERGDANAQFEVAEQLNLGAPGSQAGNGYEARTMWLRRAAASGHAKAQLAFGRCIEEGLPRDAKPSLGTAAEADAWIEAAARQGLADAQLDLAKHRATVAPAEAFKWALAAAQQGQVEAQGLAVHSFLHGIGVPVSGDAAEELCLQTGNSLATMEVARAFDEGKLVPRDPQRAFRLMRQAASGPDNEEARETLASWLEHGHNTVTDPAAALAWYRRLPMDGAVDRQLHLAELYRKTFRNEALGEFWLASALADAEVLRHVRPGWRFNVPKVPNEAQLFLHVGRQYVSGSYKGDDLIDPFGVLNALALLVESQPLEALKGEFLHAKVDELGLALWPDERAASEHFSEGARILLAERTSHLAALRSGVPAPHWFARLSIAAKNGDSRARFDLAWVYANGTGVPRNFERAITLLRPARYDPASRLFLAQLLVRNPATRKAGLVIFNELMPRVMAATDPRSLVRKKSTAVQVGPAPRAGGQAELGRAEAALGFEERLGWLRRAAEEGSTQAMGTLATLATEGKCMPADPVERLTWLTLAHAAGGQSDDLESAEKDTAYRHVVAAQAQAAAWWATHRGTNYWHEPVAR